MTNPLSRLALLGLCASMAPLAAQAQTVNLYTSREPGLIKPVLDEFTRETGVKVNIVFAQNGPRGTHRRRGRQQPRRPAADGRRLEARAGGRDGHHPADLFAG